MSWENASVRKAGAALRSFGHTQEQKHRVTFAVSVQSSPCPAFQGSRGGQDGKRRRGQQRMRWLVRSHHSVDMNLSKLGGTVKARRAWQATVHKATKSRTQLGAWTTKELDKAQEMWGEPAGIQPAGYTAKMFTGRFKVGESSSTVLPPDIPSKPGRPHPAPGCSCHSGTCPRPPALHQWQGRALISLHTVLAQTIPTPAFHPQLQQCQHQGKHKAEETVSSPRIKFLFSDLCETV